MLVPRNTDINMRLAKTGLGLLAGKTKKQAALDAGYSESVARKLEHPVSRCLEEAKKLDPALKPANLLRGARDLFRLKVEELRDDPELRSKARPSEIARMLEVSERFHGSHDPTGELSPRQFVDRMEWLREAQRLMAAKRGQRQPQDMVLSPTVTDEHQEKP